MPVLPPYLLEEPARIAILHLYPLGIWGPILAPKEIYLLRLPPPTKYLRCNPLPYLIPAGIKTTIRFNSKLQNLNREGEWGMTTVLEGGDQDSIHDGQPG